MQHAKQYVRLAIAVAIALSVQPLRAYPPEKPYDPRPLMAEAEKRVQTDQYSFIVMGDVKGSPAFPAVVKRAEALNPTFVLLTGDMVASGLPQLYDRLESQLGPFMRKIPTWPCFGNHEADRLTWGAFVKFYGINAHHYAFDFRNGRFIYVEALFVTRLPEADMKWLEQQLAEGQKAGKLLFVWQHCPAYTVGIKRKREVTNEPSDFTRLCSKYGVVADFAGHDHIYYRTYRDGVHYIIQGLGGAGVYGLNRRSEAIEGDAYYGGESRSGTLLHTPGGEKTFPKPVFMLTQIQVDGRKVTGKTISAAGEVLDEFVLLPRPEKN